MKHQVFKESISLNHHCFILLHCILLYLLFTIQAESYFWTYKYDISILNFISLWKKKFFWYFISDLVQQSATLKKTDYYFICQALHG